MKAYGFTVKEFGNDSKKGGDLFGLRGINDLGSFAKKKNGLRHYKKAARRNARFEIVAELGE
jgi:hypothetical protein